MKLGNIQFKKGTGGGGGGGVTTFNSRNGAVTLQDTDISGAGGLLADGTVAGATSQAQDFGANGIRANAIDEATSGGNVLIGANGLSSNSYVRIDNNNSDARITVNGTGTTDGSKIQMEALGGYTFSDAGNNTGMDYTQVSGDIIFGGGQLRSNILREVVDNDGVTIRSVGGIMQMQGDTVSFVVNDATDSAQLIASSINLSGKTIVSGYLRVGTTIRTGDPGSGQGEWRLGTAIAGLVGLDTTRHVEVMIDGVLTKLACAS